MDLDDSLAARAVLGAREDEVILRIDLYRADGTYDAGVTMLISEHDRAQSIDRTCQVFMAPALSALGWREPTSPVPLSLRHTDESAALKRRLQALKDGPS